MRPWGAAVAAGVGLSLMISGCTGSNGAADSSVAPTTAAASTSSTPPTEASATGSPSEAPEPETGWHLTSATLPNGATPAAIVGAAGRLWAVDADHPATLHATSDGVTWQTYDLTASGLPRKAVAGAADPGCRHALVANEQDGRVTFAYSQPVAHVGSDGLFSRQWLASIDGDTVTVTSHKDNGWDAMPGPSDGLTFRTWCITDMATFNGRQVAVGSGQWFRPFETGSVDAFAAVERSDGRWKLTSAPRKPFRDLPDGVTPSFVLPLDGRLIAVAVDRGGRYPLQVWSSVDGSSWHGRKVGFDGASGTARLSSAVATDDAIVVVGADGESATVPVAWTSPDGKAWERIELPGGAGEVNTIEHSPDGFTAYGTVDGAVATWASTDGRTWQAADAPEVQIFPGTVTQVGDGLVAQTPLGLAVSGLDWPAAQ